MRGNVPAGLVSLLNAVFCPQTSHAINCCMDRLYTESARLYGVVAMNAQTLFVCQYRLHVGKTLSLYKWSVIHVTAQWSPCSGIVMK